MIILKVNEKESDILGGLGAGVLRLFRYHGLVGKRAAGTQRITKVEEYPTSIILIVDIYERGLELCIGCRSVKTLLIECVPIEGVPHVAFLKSRCGS